MKKGFKFLLTLIFLAVLLPQAGFAGEKENPAGTPDYAMGNFLFGYSGKQGNFFRDRLNNISDNRPAVRIPVGTKGIYMTGRTFREERFGELLDFASSSEINTFVIDYKDDSGVFLEKNTNSFLLENEPSFYTEECGEKISLLKEQDIYPIARIVVFKDPHLSEFRPDWSLHRSDGSLWLDRKGISWVDPLNENVWKYAVETAKEAAKCGFREIQFDYVRFPTDGDTSEIVYDFGGRQKKDVIYDFLRYASDELQDYNVFISADVFGLTTTTVDDMGIGQQFELIAETVDYICPMVYPSHYGPGIYGIDNPNASPYETVFNAAEDAAEKLAGKKAILRPWLQDFSYGYSYGTEEVMQQKQACYDAGCTEWLFWNAGNYYNENAYIDGR